jgi:undecaprenyl-diphosphatase
MPEALQAIDVAIFRFINGTLANPVTDLLMPFITDLNQTWIGRVIIVSAWVLLILRGGKPGRAAALLVVLVVAVGDHFSSNVIKQIFGRPRPCHVVDGAVVIEGVRLLVGCGGGYAFPSSHAVNNFAAATFLSGYYPKASRYLFGYAALVALSRVFVGVHYPSDIAGGAIIGMAVGWLFLLGWAQIRVLAPPLRPYGPAGSDPSTAVV